MSKYSKISNIARSAFTLIELLVVIAIISLLVSILVPSLTKAKELSRGIVCLSNLRGIGTGIVMYADDNGSLPYQYWWTNGSSPGALTCATGGNALGLVALEGYWGDVSLEDLSTLSRKPKILKCPTEFSGTLFDNPLAPSGISYLYQTIHNLADGTPDPDKSNTLSDLRSAYALVIDMVQFLAADWQVPAHEPGETCGVLYGDGHATMKPWIQVEASWPYGVWPAWFDEDNTRNE